jgi:hypothetical protein
VSSLVRLLDRIKLHRDVSGVYSKVHTLCYSQNGKLERLHWKNAILLELTRNETYQWFLVVNTSYAISTSIKQRSVASIRRTAASERKRRQQ